MAPELLFQRLHKERASVVIIGGFAAVALGVAYATQDIDICYDPDPENAARIVRALAPLHPRLRVQGLTDIEASVLPFRLDELSLRQTEILTLRTDVGELDLMSSVPGVGSYAEVRDASTEIELYGFRLGVLDLPGLIASKRATARPKDLLMLRQIEAALRLRDR